MQLNWKIGGLALGLGVLFIVIAFVVPDAPRGEAAMAQPAE